MRRINFIALHCSDSDIASHDNAETINSWHIERGWSQIGYNFFIRSNGTIEICRPIDLVPAHIRGFNKNSLAICLHGSKNFTEKQFLSAARLCNMLLLTFDLQKKDIVAHNDLDVKKTCPNFPINKVISLLDEVADRF